MTIGRVNDQKSKQAWAWLEEIIFCEIIKRPRNELKLSEASLISFAMDTKSAVE